MRIKPSASSRPGASGGQIKDDHRRRFDFPGRLTRRGSKRGRQEPPHYEFAVDLGSRHIRILRVDEDIPHWEQNLLVLDADNREYLGADAHYFDRFVPPGFKLIRPVQRGHICDCHAAARMLRRGLTALARRGDPQRPGVLLTVPVTGSPVQIQLRHAVAQEAGASHILLAHSSVCQYLGSGGDIDDRRAILLISLGAGLTEIAVLSGGHVLAAQTVTLGGEDLDLAIRDQIRLKLLVSMGLWDAHQLMKRSCQLDWRKQKWDIIHSGWDCVGGLPVRIRVPAPHLQRPVRIWRGRVLQPLRRILDVLGPEPSADLQERGVLLLGGGALLPGMARSIRRAIPTPTALPVRLPSRRHDLWLAEVRGALTMLRDLPRYQHFTLRETPPIPDLSRLDPQILMFRDDCGRTPEAT